MWMLFSLPLQAGLEGGTIVGGQGEIINSNLVRQDSSRLAIDAFGFGVKAGETFTLQQQLSTDLALIRVLGKNPSDILGNVNAKGQLFISNPNGVLFGKNAQVNVGGLLATTLNIDVKDFMNAKFDAAKYSFYNLGNSGRVINQGNLNATEGGYIALLAPQVINEGVISANVGSVVLAAADKVTLSLDNGSLLGYTIDKGAFNALVENKQLVQADAGQVFMGAKAADSLTTAVINNSGIVRARSVKNHAGVIRLEGYASTTVTNTGSLDASAAKGSGGVIEIKSGSVALAGSVDASGYMHGGNISVSAANNLSLAERVTATGREGNGGSVVYRAGGEIIEVAGSSTDVSGRYGGAISVYGAQGVISSGSYQAKGYAGKGGAIDVSGFGVRLLSAALNASGTMQGGLVRVGGDYQGGNADISGVNYQQFAGRWQGAADIENSQRLFVNDSTTVNVSSSSGAGGTAIFWSDKETTMLGQVDASGKVRGGAVEMSSAEVLRYANLAGVHGAETLLLDPRNIVIGSAVNVNSWIYSAIFGKGYAAGNNLDVTGLANGDFFGISVALNAAGDRLAVGSHRDDGAGNLAMDSGAVRLFSFADNNYSGGSLQATIGKGYVGGKNVDVALDAGDFFGSSVAFNAAGDRLAVGAINDGGVGNLVPSSGAVHLFSFSDNNFNGGNLQATIGKGYVGAKDINLGSLDSFDWFGVSVALNAAGDRLAVGAHGDDGFGGMASNSGAVRLFSFADNNFNGGSLQSTIGNGYSGSKDLNIANLEGVSVAFNAVGDRLAVGSSANDGAAADAMDSGAVHLFSFSDGNFSGATLEARIGSGYAGGKNLDVAGLETGDFFGTSVALNAKGDLLAVGASGDRGFNNDADNSGAVRIFGFADNNFAGANLLTTIGKGYTGANNVDLAGLIAGDLFGSSVALNARGDRLAVGAESDRGAPGDLTNAGAVYLFKSNLVSPAGGSVFASNPADDVTILFSDLEAILGAGTNVVLQANNDIAVLHDVTVNNTVGNGGDLTLQAGRNIDLNAIINTDYGDFTAVAGDPAALPAHRLPGTPTITLGAGTFINTGTGKTNVAAIDGNFINNSGSAAPITAGQWLVYSAGPASNILNGMSANEQYSQPYVAGSTPVYAASGNWLLYSAANPVKPPVNPPDDVFDDAQKPPPGKPLVDKPLQDVCGGGSLIVTSAGSAFERFTDIENDSCGLEMMADESGKPVETNCTRGKSSPSAKEKTEKL